MHLDTQIKSYQLLQNIEKKNTLNINMNFLQGNSRKFSENDLRKQFHGSKNCP